MNTIDVNKTFCVYLNVKRLHIPENFDQEIFNRIFCVFLYSELSKQLFSYLESLTEESVWNKFIQLFDQDFSKVKVSIQETLIKLSLFQSIALKGSQKLSEIDKASENMTISESELLELKTKLATKFSKNPSINIEIDSKLSEELKKIK